MAKELPYFKFEPNQWENGNIQMLSREDKGLFVDLCSMYWSRLGDVPFKLAVQKLCGGNATAFNSLCEEKIIEVIDSNIYIKFLSIQLDTFEDTSKQNSKNAKEGWEKRRKQKEESDRNATASNSQSETDAIREEEIKEKKIKKEVKFNFKKSLLDLGIKENLVNDWILVRKKLNAVNTETSFLKIKNQLLKIEGDINSGIEMAIENSWRGFEYEWYLNKKNNLNNGTINKGISGQNTTPAKNRIATDFTKDF